jgi:hypothetical protein
MKSTRRYLIPGLILAAGLTTIGQNAAASTRPGPTLTIQVINSAQVGDKTLIEAEKIAAGIFGKAGIEIRWTYTVPPSEDRNGSHENEDSSSLSLIHLNIVPQVFDELSIPRAVMGLAPGDGRNRQWAYVFYDRVIGMAKEQIRERTNGMSTTSATPAQILAHAMAHEVGHLLLNLEIHSEIGIMRGIWDEKDLQDVACGELSFTSKQAKAIRAEVSRRIAEHETVEVASR